MPKNALIAWKTRSELDRVFDDGSGGAGHWTAKVGRCLERLLYKGSGQGEIKDHTFRDQCQFRGGDRIISITFPEIAITAADIFAAAGL